MTLVERWLIWRRRNKLSQLEAGRTFGVGLHHVRLIERGILTPYQFIEDRYLPVMASPGEELWLMRRRHALSQREAAALLDIPVCTLSQLENDQKSMIYRDLTDVDNTYRVGLSL